MRRTTTKVLALVVASSLAVLGLFITRPAFAATNGQQLQVCQKPSEDYQTMRLRGNNQDGDSVIAEFEITTGGCGNTAGFYWVGWVTVLLMDSATGLPPRTSSCSVPKEGRGLVDCFL